MRLSSTYWRALRDKALEGEDAFLSFKVAPKHFKYIKTSLRNKYNRESLATKKHLGSLCFTEDKDTSTLVAKLRTVLVLAVSGNCIEPDNSLNLLEDLPPLEDL